MHVLPKCISDTFIPLFSFIIIDPIQIEVVSEQSFEENICTTQEGEWQDDKSYVTDGSAVDTAIKIIFS